MSSTLLQLVRTFCQRRGLPVPAAVVTSQDHQVIQILALLNESLEDMVDRWDWTELQYQATFTTTAGEDQGAVTDYATSGFLRIFNETIWNRTLRLPLFGPMSKEQWQQLKALATTGPFYKYRIMRGRILFNPVGVEDQECAFEYQSSWSVIPTASLIATKAVFDADTDTCVFDDKILLAALAWKWLANKGLEYAEDFRRYEMLGNNGAGRDGTKRRVDTAASTNSLVPGIWISPGNWPIN